MVRTKRPRSQAEDGTVLLPRVRARILKPSAYRLIRRIRQVLETADGAQSQMEGIMDLFSPDEEVIIEAIVLEH